MLKKIALVVSLFCLIAFSVPAMATMNGEYYDYGDAYLNQGQFGVNLLITGLVIDPIDIEYSENEAYGDCGWASDFGLYWGGMSIDILAVQVIGQQQSMGTCGYSWVDGHQCFKNKLSLESDGLKIEMMQKSSQSGWADSYGYWD